MENASKALLIAGSVLIVILLIAFGVRIFNSTGDVGDQVDGTMQTTEVTMFNNKFLPYIGKNKSKNDALTLTNLIIASNSTNNIKIRLGYNIKNTSGSYSYDTSYATTANVQSLCMQRISECDASKKFTIQIKGYTAKGYIEEIYISTSN